MSNTQLIEAAGGQPPEIQAEIIRINTEARPLALQVALLVPIIAGLLGPAQFVPDEPAARHHPIVNSRGHVHRLMTTQLLSAG